MRIFICTSKRFYNRIPEILAELEEDGHELTMPNSYDNPSRENEMKTIGIKDHAEWKSKMIKEQEQKIKANDALLILNFNKGNSKNYIGGAVFLEMYKAWELGKKIFLYNSIPNSILTDEILGFQPIIINGNLSAIEE